MRRHGRIGNAPTMLPHGGLDAARRRACDTRVDRGSSANPAPFHPMQLHKLSGGGWACTGWVPAGGRRVPPHRDAGQCLCHWCDLWQGLGLSTSDIARATSRALRSTLPDNAYLTGSSYGDGWKCDRGYEKGLLRCVSVNVPVNGFLSDSSRGRAWECNRGYRPEGASCVAIRIPANGYLADTRYGKGWTCDRGYREAGDACLKMVLPDNAHLSSNGTSWQCARGFARSGETCSAIQLPLNAFVDDGGNSWDCAPPFRRSSGSCVPR